MGKVVTNKLRKINNEKYGYTYSNHGKLMN